ncbi:MAG: trimethylamine methyltransferase family protein [Planctomycetia bacterium]|nr:trimethylamine methyltransferase family protein [Planctomycetia bacterium]
MRLFGGVKVLTKQQMYEIHCTALRVITDIGLECHISDDAFDKLEAQGVRVDRENRRVWLGEEHVLESIRQMAGAGSTNVTVDGTDADPLPQVLPARLVFAIGSAHGFIVDGDEMRHTRLDDMFDCIRLQKHLLGEAGSPGMVNQDVPGEVQPIHTAAFNVKYCENPGAPDCNNSKDAAWITRIMQAAGAWDENQQHLGSVYARSPLCAIHRATEFLELAAKAGTPHRATGMPTAGVTAPGTAAGYLVEYIAESFGFTTIGRLITDAPNNVVKHQLHGDAITAFEMRKGIYYIAGPEISLMRLASKQIFGEFYKFSGDHNYGVRTFTDAKVPGIQAAMEKTFQAMSDLMAGIYTNQSEPAVSMSCTGSLNCNLSLSLEQAVIDHELFSCMGRFILGIRADTETLGFDAIERVGPSGEFLSDEHTVKHIRDEWYFPTLFHRGAWDVWTAEGRPTVLSKAREIVAEAKKIEIECVLPDDTAREIDRLVQEAEHDLLGSTTGLLP